METSAFFFQNVFRWGFSKFSCLKALDIISSRTRGIYNLRFKITTLCRPRISILAWRLWWFWPDVCGDSDLMFVVMLTWRLWRFWPEVCGISDLMSVVILTWRLWWFWPEVCGVSDLTSVVILTWGLWWFWPEVCGDSDLRFVVILTWR